MDNFENEHTHRIAVLIIGESFRSGSQGSRRKGHPDSVDDQILACGSHTSLFDDLISQGVHDIDVFINTYSTPYDDKINDIYGKRVKGHNFITTYNVTPEGMHDHLYMAKSLLHVGWEEKYNMILALRIDLVLKGHRVLMDHCLLSSGIVASNSNTIAAMDKIAYPSVCFIPYHIHNGKPRVNCMFAIIPKSCFDLLNSRQRILDHAAWDSLPDGKAMVILDTYHDSDSEKDFNTMYRVANRPETTVWHSQGYRFDRTTLQPIRDANVTI